MPPSQRTFVIAVREHTVIGVHSGDSPIHERIATWDDVRGVTEHGGVVPDANELVAPPRDVKRSGPPLLRPPVGLLVEQREGDEAECRVCHGAPEVELRAKESQPRGGSRQRVRPALVVERVVGNDDVQRREHHVFVATLGEYGGARVCLEAQDFDSSSPAGIDAAPRHCTAHCLHVHGVLVLTGHNATAKADSRWPVSVSTAGSTSSVLFSKN